jgi:phospholipid-binding lipoprotein MlaA
MTPILRIAATVLGLSLVAGCATVPRDPVARAVFEANHDPLEPLNRDVFAFNLALDRAAIKPLAEAYRWTVPQGARDDVHNVLMNLNEPLVLANCILQGRLKAAGITISRFVINSTLGFAGTGDVASEWKLPQQIGDSGQTLASWGYAEGPYLVVPLFGPSSVRDGLGRIGDVYLDGFRYIARRQNYPTFVTTGRIIADGMGQRERSLDTLDELQRESIDYYAALRSLYRQNRAAELRGDLVPQVVPAAGFYDDPGK